MPIYNLPSCNPKSRMPASCPLCRTRFTRLKAHGQKNDGITRPGTLQPASRFEQRRVRTCPDPCPWPVSKFLQRRRGAYRAARQRTVPFAGHGRSKRRRSLQRAPFSQCHQVRCLHFVRRWIYVLSILDDAPMPLWNSLRLYSDDQRSKAFAVNTKCLTKPGGGRTAEVSCLESGSYNRA